MNVMASMARTATTYVMDSCLEVADEALLTDKRNEQSDKAPSFGFRSRLGRTGA
jgi:hypothetical protein